MYKKIVTTIIFLCLLFILCIENVEAATTEKLDVQIDPNDYVGDPFWSTSKGDKIDVKVESDLPVDVYIVSSDDYFELYGPDVEKAKYSEEGVTSTKFTYKIPDDQSYFLVIKNPNNSIATVDYEYTDILSEDVQSAFLGFTICAIIVVVGIILVIILIVYFATRKKRGQQPYYPPQQPYYPPQQQTGYQPPPPPPSQQPQRPNYPPPPPPPGY